MKIPNTFEKKEKIAIYVPSLEGGGAERMMVHLANGFAQRGYSVDLVLAKAKGPYLTEVNVAVKVVDLGSSRTFFSIPGLVRYLRRARPSAMLSALNHANVVACLAQKVAGVPVRLVISERNMLSVQKVTNLRGRIVHLFMKIVYPWADSVVAVSKGVADDLVHDLGLEKGKLHTIYNPVVTDELLINSEIPVEHPWFYDNGPPVILGVGRLTEQKDFATLIGAFSLARDKIPARLMILGEGELRSKLEALVNELGLNEFVQLPGFVTNPYSFMSRSKVFVLSSRFEGLPGALIQAMACGTPVISTNCPSGPCEILENGKWGCLVPVADEIAMAKAIVQTLCKVTFPQVKIRASDFGAEQALTGYLNLLVNQPKTY